MTSLPFPIAQTSTSDPYERCRHAAMGMSALCTLAPQTLLHDSVASIFQSCAVPKMSLAKYAVYIAARCSHGEEAVLIGLVLMARYCRTVNQMPTAYTEHRLLLAAIVVGSKAHYDDFYKNVYMARIGGVGTKELAQLELHFIMNIKGSLVVSPREMARFRSTFEGLGAGITDATTPEAKANARSQAQRLGTYLMLEEVTAAPDYLPIFSDKATIPNDYSPINNNKALKRERAVVPKEKETQTPIVAALMREAVGSSPLVPRCSTTAVVCVKMYPDASAASMGDSHALMCGSSCVVTPPPFASVSLARSSTFE